MAKKPTYELDSAQCLAELPYYNHTGIPKRSKPPLYQRGVSLPLITPDQHELPPYHGWSEKHLTHSEIGEREWPKHDLNKYYNPKTRWSNRYRWNCNQRGYEYRKPKQILLGKDKRPQTPKEKGLQATEAETHGCPKCQSCPKAPEEDNTPPSWFLKWRETNMTPQEDDDTAPTWFTDYMDYMHDSSEPPIWFTRHVLLNKLKLRPKGAI